MSRLKNREGIALITTLLVIALLVAVVVEFNRIAIADIDVSKNFADDKKILYLTISSVNAIKELLRLDGIYTKSDTLLEEWANSRSYFDFANSILDKGRVEGIISDENGKIHVNSLGGAKGDFSKNQRALWERLLSQSRFGLNEEEINTIIYGVMDWIDKDDEITGIYGAEDSFYQGKGYHCKNGPLDQIEEMLLINGVSEDIFYGNEYKSGIRPYFTVYGGGTININTAPLPVLMALSDEMTESLAQEMDAFRKDEANKTLLNSKDWYKRIWPFDKPLPEKLITVSSSYFTALVQGHLADSGKRIKAVIFRSSTSANLVFWQEM